MAVLHLVNRPAALESCLETASPQDVILLMEDGVYAGINPEIRWTCYAIDVDVRARGIGKRMNPGVNVVTYADFVHLAVTHSPIVTWR